MRKWERKAEKENEEETKMTEDTWEQAYTKTGMSEEREEKSVEAPPEQEPPKLAAIDSHMLMTSFFVASACQSMAGEDMASLISKIARVQ